MMKWLSNWLKSYVRPLKYRAKLKMERTFRSEVSEERVGDQLATVPIHTATMGETYPGKST